MADPIAAFVENTKEVVFARAALRNGHCRGSDLRPCTTSSEKYYQEARKSEEAEMNFHIRRD
jgi:hypothetical protein